MKHEIKISKNNYNDRFTVRLETKAGKLYYCDYATEPTIEEVKEDWRDNRKWFNHQN